MGVATNQFQKGLIFGFCSFALLLVGMSYTGTVLFPSDYLIEIENRSQSPIERVTLNTGLGKTIIQELGAHKRVTILAHSGEYTAIDIAFYDKHGAVHTEEFRDVRAFDNYRFIYIDESYRVRLGRHLEQLGVPPF
ncbi:MAG: hypothetical protein BWY75_00819 [bacterium ADurb.Bin425]|jgi:hypothetical protein|nr:MAG: hypothetical protein BWY75_00819 [bacterium ADurb.Bin425]